MATGIKTLTVNLSSDDVTAHYTFDTYDEPDFYEPIHIQYLNRTADAGINNISYQGQSKEKLYSIHAVDYSDDLYNKRITYRIMRTGDVLPKLREHFREIASAMHLGLIWIVSHNFDVPCNEPLVVENQGTDYETKYEVHEGTLTELVDRLIGWSRQIPNMQYSIRIWDNALNVVERGAERQTVNLANGKIARNPIFSMKQIFTYWYNSTSSYDIRMNYIYSSANSLSKKPFTGEIQAAGNRKLTYQNGYLQSEIVGNTSSPTMETTYTYTTPTTSSTDNVKYLALKTVIDHENNEKTITDYTYYDTANERYLSSEFESHYFSADSGQTWQLDSALKTDHAPCGNGNYCTTTYEIIAGVSTIVSTSTGNGGAGGKISQYMVDTQQEGLTNNSDIESRRAYIMGASRVGSTFPVHDVSTLNEIARNINSLCGQFEITCNVDVYGINTAIDCDSIVVFGGENWHVQSNTIEITPFHKMQQLTLIRWGWE